MAGFAIAEETEIAPLSHDPQCPGDVECVLPVNANITLQYTGAGAMTDAVVSIDVYPRVQPKQDGAGLCLLMLKLCLCMLSIHPSILDERRFLVCIFRGLLLRLSCNSAATDNMTLNSDHPGDRARAWTGSR
jgi:hypothetical protein